MKMFYQIKLESVVIATLLVLDTTQNKRFHTIIDLPRVIK